MSELYWIIALQVYGLHLSDYSFVVFDYLHFESSVLSTFQHIVCIGTYLRNQCSSSAYSPPLLPANSPETKFEPVVKLPCFSSKVY